MARSPKRGISTGAEAGPKLTERKKRPDHADPNQSHGPNAPVPRTPRLPPAPTEATLTILPIRGAVLFPHNVLPLTVGKEWSQESIEQAIKASDNIGIITQLNTDEESRDPSGLYTVGTEARILKIIRFPDGTQGAVVQGARRFRVRSYLQTSKESDEPLRALVDYFEDTKGAESLEISALGRGLRQLVQKAVTLSPNVPNEANIFIENVTDPSYLADLVIPYLGLEYQQKQELLELPDLEARLRKVHHYLTKELEVLEVSQRIHSEVRSEVGKQQRKYYLREQLKQLQKELGELDGREISGADEPAELGERIAASAMPKEAREQAQREVDRMNLMQPGSPEYMVSHTYVNWLLDVPWGVHSQNAVDLASAQSLLDADHFGLEKIKKRIIEYLAVYSLKQDLKGPIMLLAGPPGVGKTSLGRSVAQALGRKFVRVSLGGVRDESEIRGHRRTYIGSMPGKIIDSIKKAGSMDPVILLDEIDKLGADMRGDPASALLEVLDPEQNQSFVDHYLNTPVDLSKVLFIATANSTATIPAPLLDRMEPISLAGYTLQEKSQIAERFLLPQVAKEHGLDQFLHLHLARRTLEDVVENYTREAGVRQLKRELAGIARAIAREYVEMKQKSTAQANRTEGRIRVQRRTVTSPEVRRLIGPPRFQSTARVRNLPAGVALGLAYTPVGGDVLFIESAWSQAEGQGRLSLTGQLGDVMKESVQTALAFLRAFPERLGLEPGQLGKHDLHVHFPEGAIPKDGPSAGMAVLTALVSLVSGKAVPSDLAMTGEISLRGDLLPVGGIKEKLLAAHRYGIKQIILPAQNEKDLDDLPAEAKNELRIHLVSKMTDALDIVFGKKSQKEPSQKKKTIEKKKEKASRSSATRSTPTKRSGARQ